MKSAAVKVRPGDKIRLSFFAFAGPPFHPSSLVANLTQEDHSREYSLCCCELPGALAAN